MLLPAGTYLGNTPYSAGNNPDPTTITLTVPAGGGSITIKGSSGIYPIVTRTLTSTGTASRFGFTVDTFHGTTVNGNSLDLQDVGASAGLSSVGFGEWEIGPTPPLEPGIPPLIFYYAGARTPAAQMPSGGSISYTGQFVGRINTSQYYLLGGLVAITVNYATGVKTVNGSITNMNIFNESTGANLGTTNSMSFSGTLNANTFAALGYFSPTGGTSGINLYPTHSAGIAFQGIFCGTNALEMAGTNTFGPFGVHQ